MVSTLVVEWIEISCPWGVFETAVRSPPSWWSGLKYHGVCDNLHARQSPPSWWSGLKFTVPAEYLVSVLVSTLVVEWIEISDNRQRIFVCGSLHPRGGVD